jgi:hypothetical protein
VASTRQKPQKWFYDVKFRYPLLNQTARQQPGNQAEIALTHQSE